MVEQSSLKKEISKRGKGKKKRRRKRNEKKRKMQPRCLLLPPYHYT
jgi:hypothetical protein